MRSKSTERFVAGYIRVSTEMQVERESLQNQEQALRVYCQTNGDNLHLYRDEGVSAKDIERPQLQPLLAAVRSGQVSTVLVTKLDRISRSLHDLLDLMALFEEHEVQFIFDGYHRVTLQSQPSPLVAGRLPTARATPRTVASGGHDEVGHRTDWQTVQQQCLPRERKCGKQRAK